MKEMARVYGMPLVIKSEEGFVARVTQQDHNQRKG